MYVRPSLCYCFFLFFFFFNDTATTEIYTLSLHDALPILPLEYVDCLIKHPTKVSARGAPDAKLQRITERLWVCFQVLEEYRIVCINGVVEECGLEEWIVLRVVCFTLRCVHFSAWNVLDEQILYPDRADADWVA